MRPGRRGRVADDQPRRATREWDRVYPMVDIVKRARLHEHVGAVLREITGLSDDGALADE